MGVGRKRKRRYLASVFVFGFTSSSPCAVGIQMIFVRQEHCLYFLFVVDGNRAFRGGWAYNHTKFKVLPRNTLTCLLNFCISMLFYLATVTRQSYRLTLLEFRGELATYKLRIWYDAHVP